MRGRDGPDRRRSRLGGLPAPHRGGDGQARPGPHGGGGLRITLSVNGEHRQADAWEGESLLYFLRERLGLWGSKNACEQGECGSCSVLVDGALVCACLVLAATVDGGEVLTVEGLDRDPVGRAVQSAMVETGGVQCGFCTPGFVVAMTELLRRDPDPTETAFREALSGNLCRCTGYVRIFDALRRAAEELRA